MSDDEIQIIEIGKPNRSGNDDVCQLCNLKFDGLSPSERQTHYHLRHVDGVRSTRSRSKPTSSTNPPKKSVSAGIKKLLGRKDEDEWDIFWYPTQASDPPKNYTPGLLPILKDALKHSHRRDITRRAVLCYEQTPHILRESLDTGWGCGYRNFLMACAALMDQQFQPHYSAHLNDPIPPGVRNLQRWIEDAWKQGYDTIGADELEHELVDTRKQLGTGELYSAFTSRRIPCGLMEFDLQKSHRGFDALTSWVVSYFSEDLKPKGDVNTVLLSSSPVVANAKKMPIIMQYEGHSVTIVGFEIAKNGDTHLLIFDPSSSVNKSFREAAQTGPSSVDWKPPVLGKGKRRERSNSPISNKRPREEQDPDDDVVCIEASNGKETNGVGRSVISPVSLQSDLVIKAFRMSTKHKNKGCYQLLYFTMGDPLSDQEQNERKVVYSEVGC